MVEFFQPADIDSSVRALNEQGWFVVGNLQDAVSAERFLETYWTLIPQYDGQISNGVKAERQYADLPLSGSTDEIGPHTDGIALQTPPDLLALYCVQPAKCGGGYTNLSDGYKILPELDKDELKLCREKHFRFYTEGELLEEKRHEAEHCIVEDLEESRSTRINFSHNYFYWGDINPVSRDGEFDQGDPILQRVVDKFTSLSESLEEKVLIPERGLLVWDNRRFVHSRDAFSDPRRHLLRYWLSLD